MPGAAPMQLSPAAQGPGEMATRATAGGSRACTGANGRAEASLERWARPRRQEAPSSAWNETPPRATAANT
eukprot:13653870-Alexandrium_andersonii.AAC.1